jgi:hypothetical protein
VTPLPDGPLVEPGPVWDESPAEAAAADRAHFDRDEDGPMDEAKNECQNSYGVFLDELEDED